MLLKNKGLETVDVFRKIFVEKNIAELNRYFIGFLHGFKNTFFNIKILADKADDEITDQSVYSVRKISEIASDTIDSIARTINSLTDINVKPKRNNLCSCVDAALLEANLASHSITVEKKYDQYNETFAYFDFYLVKTAFMNIFKNAVEAIEIKEIEDGIIKVDISSQSRLIAVSITDNGTGIRRRDIRKIFNMFYTTKSRQKNWGAGLQYVANIVRNHLGIINVYSSYEKYTTFEVIMNKAHFKRGRFFMN
jgi:nitrogen fixation/metabolism regulation signal transduction histidine kinase